MGFNEINYLDGIDIVYNSKLPSVFTSNETAKAVSNTILTTVGITTEQLLSQADDGAVIKDKEVQQFIYDTVNNPNLTKKENMAIQQKYFKIFYNLLFGTDAGPRLYLFFAASDKNTYLELLNI